MLCLASLLAGSMREEGDEGMVRIGVDGFFTEWRSGCGRLLPLLSFPISTSLPRPGALLAFTGDFFFCVCVCWPDLLTN